MSYSSLIVANTILRRSFKEARGDISPMKLQKLAFYLQGWMLAVFDKPATNENFEAWKYGPVLPSLYQATRNFGAAPVGSYLVETFDGKVEARVVPVTNSEFHQILDLVWENYVGHSAVTLSTMTHADGSPWHNAIGAIGSNNPISNDSIKSYFVGLIKNKPGN
jgi:uncharacterized phage-associated protein